jgi:hypothetical protein
MRIFTWECSWTLVNKTHMTAPLVPICILNLATRSFEKFSSGYKHWGWHDFTFHCALGKEVYLSSCSEALLRCFWDVWLGLMQKISIRQDDQQVCANESAFFIQSSGVWKKSPVALELTVHKRKSNWECESRFFGSHFWKIKIHQTTLVSHYLLCRVLGFE